jgi:hypothetical protein
MKRIAVVLLGFACFGALSGVAGDIQNVNPYSAVFSQVIPAEMPAKAATLVKKEKARDRSTSTVNVVKAALAANAPSACAVVSSISKAVSEMAPVAAGTAAEVQPSQVVAIAKAAANAAPSKAAKIVVAVCRAAPKSRRAVAVAVCEAVPGSNQAILTAMAAAFPELAAGISQALAKSSSEFAPVGSILDQAVTVASAPTGVRGPSIGAPYSGGNGAPSDINGTTPGNSTPVPPGGANYASP